MLAIKFRAWDKKRKRMYQVLHLHLDSREGVWATVRGFDVINQMDIHLSIQPQNINLMQYTDLKDKNGKEIYEADRLKQGAFTRTVRYNIGKGAWYAGELRLTQTLAIRMEIKDNIFENKNLEGDYV